MPVVYSKEPTARQSEVLDCIRASIRDRGFPPTLREIGAKLNITSPNGVMANLRALERKGIIRRDAETSRGITLVGEAKEAGRIARLESDRAKLYAACCFALARGTFTDDARRMIAGTVAEVEMKS